MNRPIFCIIRIIVAIWDLASSKLTLKFGTLLFSGFIILLFLSIPFLHLVIREIIICGSGDKQRFFHRAFFWQVLCLAFIFLMCLLFTMCLLCAIFLFGLLLSPCITWASLEKAMLYTWTLHAPSKSNKCCESPTETRSPNSSLTRPLSSSMAL